MFVGFFIDLTSFKVRFSQQFGKKIVKANFNGKLTS